MKPNTPRGPIDNTQSSIERISNNLLFISKSSTIIPDVFPDVLPLLFLMHVPDSLSHVQLFATPWTIAYQAPPSMGFSRQECWSGLPFPSPTRFYTKCLTFISLNICETIRNIYLVFVSWHRALKTLVISYSSKRRVFILLLLLFIISLFQLYAKEVTLGRVEPFCLSNQLTFQSYLWVSRDGKRLEADHQCSVI